MERYSDIPEAYFQFREGRSLVPAMVTRPEGDFLWLGCCVEGILYDFPTHTGQAYLLPGHKTDGQSVVRYFRLLDSRVRRICTWSAGQCTTVYTCEGPQDT